jgi:hypothetical protein
MKILTLGGMLLLTFSGTAWSQTTYGVNNVQIDKKTDFAKVKTYTWTTRYSAFDKDVHTQIVAAFDRELARLGLTKQDSGAGDVIVVYDAQRRTDTDPSVKAAPDGSRPTFAVGTLVFRMLDPGGQRILFGARLDNAISLDREQLAEQIDQAAAALLAKYPARVRSK